MSARWTWHGGGLAAARAHFGDGGDPWIDLSTGINPHAWPGVDDLRIDWQRLPEEHELRALEAAAAAHFGARPEQVCALPGTEAGLRLIGETLPGPARYVVPSYRTHGEMIAGAQPVCRGAIGDAAGQTLVLANPNNPDGHVFDRPELLDIYAQRGTEGWLVIDEAFGDCAPQMSMAPYLQDDRRLMIFRSFGKFFGLAGVRLGFVLGPATLIAAIRSRLGAWPVSAAAIAIGTAAYRDRGWTDATRRQLVREAAALDAVLALHGLDASGDCPLFRLVEADDAAALFARLARQAILTRPFADNPRWLRIGLPRDTGDLARLDAALRDG